MKKLTFEQLKTITLGALFLEELPQGVRFHRLTDAQTEAFRLQDAGLARKCAACAGIRFDFHTDATSLSLTYRDQTMTSSRTWSYFDVLVNGTLLLHSGTEDVPTHPDGHFQVSLPEGENHVEIYLPTLSALTIESLSLSDGASLRPHRPQRKFLVHGDSITQGYDARCPSNSYINRLARHYDAEVLNQAIGSACFDGNVIERVADPDFILVSCGANDWRFRDWDTFCAGAEGFFRRLRELYPTAPVFDVLPIWRADLNAGHPCAGEFLTCRAQIARTAEKYGCTVLDDYHLLPHDTRLFSDGELHPNDEGFFLYAQRLIELLDAHL